MTFMKTYVLLVMLTPVSQSPSFAAFEGKRSPVEVGENCILIYIFLAIINLYFMHPFFLCLFCLFIHIMYNFFTVTFETWISWLISVATQPGKLKEQKRDK